MADRTALIIGASRGIGLGLTKELAGRGYRVIASERNRSDDLHAVAEGSDGAVEIVNCDVTKPDSYRAIAADHPENSVDLLVLNAGVSGPSDQALSDLEPGKLADILETNAIGPTQAAIALLPLMKEGSIIGMMSSKMGSINDSSGGRNYYRLSKVAQNMLARSLFENHAKDRGVGVVSLHPGWVQTDMGGPDALIDVDTSVTGMVDLLENADRSIHRFVDYSGETVSW